MICSAQTVSARWTPHLLLALFFSSVVSQAATTYTVEVLADSPAAYFPMNEPGPASTDVATNRGAFGAAGNGTYHVGVIHPVSGALAGDPDTAASYVAIDSQSDDGGSPTLIPYSAALNPVSSFTVEAWLMPVLDGTANAQCPLVSRFIDGNGQNFGWVIYQRSAATGWNLRLYN